MPAKTPASERPCAHCGERPRDPASSTKHLCEPCRLSYNRTYYRNKRGVSTGRAARLEIYYQQPASSRTDLPCSACGQMLPLNAFHRRRNTPRGRHAVCKKCRKTISRKKQKGTQ